MTDPTSAYRPFDILDELSVEPHTLLLEASAGTGKTWTIGALVARYVAEGLASLDEILVITFGRAATRELRQRVRQHLVDAARVLSGTLDPGDDELLRHLGDAEPDVRQRRLARLRGALAAYDAATIATTHEFCGTVLRSLGVAGDSDPGATLVENLDDLVAEVVDDLYLQRYGHLAEPPLPPGTAHQLGLDAVNQAHTRLLVSDPADDAQAERLAFADGVRQEVQRRKRRRNLLGYDDLLSRLADALADAASPAAERMRERWKVVLVDEFQDTDPVQWQVLDRAFTGHAAMVLIGDPKQAIYAFRGGDVPSYLAAADRADDARTLATNRRSDQPLVDALQVLLGGAALGDPRIVVHPVRAAHDGSRLVGAPHAAPLRLRQIRAGDFGGEPSDRIPVGRARTRIAADLAGDVAALLASDATFDGRPIEAGDVAILMYSLKQAQLFTDALAERGVAAVVTNAGSVLLSPAAQDWLTLLEALEQPQRAPLIRALALTPFVGRSVADLDAGGDEATDAVAEQVRAMLDLWRSRGIAAVFEAFVADGLAERVLGLVGGERRLTDLEHLGEILHGVAQHDRLGLSALLDWVRRERRLAVRSGARARRLDTDRHAVQLLTIHGSKGLQFPIVYLPLAFNRWVDDREQEALLYHDVDGRRCLDVGRAGPGSVAGRLAAVEAAAEELRLTYVALTRAQSQVVAWWAPTRDARHGGLTRLLFARHAGDVVVPDTVEAPDDDSASAWLGVWEAAGAIAVEHAEPVASSTVAPSAPVPALAVRTFDRPVDLGWRRTSYSGLIREDPGTATSEPEIAGTVDEPDPVDGEVAPVLTDARPDDSPVSPMADLPAGATFGSLVHAILEIADPQAQDLHAELARGAREQARWWPVEATPDELAAALVPVIRTPLGPLASGLTLGDFGRTERLCELDFEIPLDGGDLHADRRDVLLAGVGEIMRAHLPEDDPMRVYADRLSVPGLGGQILRGYLSGSIDVVLCIGDRPRYLVVDYKTNLLATGADRATAWDYRPEALAAAMLHSDYPLQAMLYSAVLHRYLRWRVPDYDPDRDLGGILYLYLRGMCGPDTPTYDGHPAGVFSWHPPAAMVVALSDLLAGVRS
ncbi:MAG TPA: UvrD-helicase domain-containing protein [Marmoricola sp.]